MKALSKTTWDIIRQNHHKQYGYVNDKRWWRTTDKSYYYDMDENDFVQFMALSI